MLEYIYIFTTPSQEQVWCVYQGANLIFIIALLNKYILLSDNQAEAIFSNLPYQFFSFHIVDLVCVKLSHLCKIMYLLYKLRVSSSHFSKHALWIPFILKSWSRLCKIMYLLCKLRISVTWISWGVGNNIILLILWLLLRGSRSMIFCISHLLLTQINLFSKKKWTLILVQTRDFSLYQYGLRSK